MRSSSPLQNQKQPEDDGKAQYSIGTRIRLLERCRPYYSQEYQGELTISGTDRDDYARRYYTFAEYPESTIFLLEFQIVNEFERVS